ncbi:MAG: T9SS type A sorting domain-containing protein [Candidatus Marinimicrobia bacterium]|nr:T9SS type A sorting domain-containing protein [Candidatus Neomarinimicrobiota bacterium]
MTKCFFVSILLFSVGFGIPDFYHSPAEITAFLDSLQNEHPDFLHVRTIAYSAEDGLPIQLAVLSDNPSVWEDEPSVLFQGQHHAEEIYGVEFSLHLIEEILNRVADGDYGALAWIYQLQIVVIPTNNPEGLQVVFGYEENDELIQDDSFRKNKRDANENGQFDWDPQWGWDIDGVDLNRNYDFQWAHGCGFMDECGNEAYDYYRGGAPFSEPEISVMQMLCDSVDFSYSLAWHSSRTGNLSEGLYFCWNYDNKLAPDFDIHSEIAMETASQIGSAIGTGTYQPSPARKRYGNAHTWLYREHRVVQFLIEAGPPQENQIQTENFEYFKSYEEENLNAAFYLIDRTLANDYGNILYGHATDAETGEPLQAKIQVLDTDTEILNSYFCEPNFGRFHRILSVGIHQIVASCEGYESDTISVSIAPATKTEVEISLQPKNWLNLYLMSNVDSLISVWIDGEFRFEFAINETVSLPEGEYEMAFSGGGVPIFKMCNLTSDQELGLYWQSHSESLIDDFENGGENWQLGEWSIFAPELFDGSNSLRFGDADFYSNNSDAICELATPLNLSDVNQAAIEFLQYVHFEPENDFGTIEVSTDGENWQEIARFSGYSGEWQKQICDLAAFCGNEEVSIRFRAQTDDSLDDLGWAIDDVRILGCFAETNEIENNSEFSIENYKLHNACPNPFNPSTVINYQLPVTSAVTLQVYNLQGKLVETLVNKMQVTGYYSVDFDGSDFASGIYFYRLETPEFSDVKKMVLLK